MARSKRAAAGAGHNSTVTLTDDERDALATHYALKVIADEKLVAQKKADLDAARSAVNGHFKMIAKDLGETRKDFERDVIAIMGMNEAEYVNSEARRFRRHQMAGAKPPGAQLDLVERINDTVDDANQAEADGYRAGRRADDPVPPTTLSPIFVTDWMRGWTMGQEFNGLQLGKAAEILARPKPGVMTAAEEPEEEEDPADPEVIKAAARKLQKAGWTEPTEDEQQFEAVA